MAMRDSLAVKSEVSKVSEAGVSAAVRELHDRDPVFHLRLGLQLPQKIAYERWLAIGRQLSDLATSSAWCLGDWLVYGESSFNGRYRQAIEQTSLNYQTLRNYAWVAKKFPLSRRRDTLSFGHHLEVAALTVSEQDYWLRKAEEFDWSCKQLRSELRASLMERASDENDEGENEEGGRQRARSSLRLELSPSQLESCRMAAEQVGLSLTEWVVRALEQAAHEVVARHFAIDSLAWLFGFLGQ